MTMLESQKIIGARALLRVEAFSVMVEVMDVKQAYGNTRYLVEPIGGHGEAWVDKSRIKIVEAV